MAPPCASIFLNGNEAKTRARDLKDASFPTASTSTSQNFDTDPLRHFIYLFKQIRKNPAFNRGKGIVISRCEDYINIF